MRGGVRFPFPLLALALALVACGAPDHQWLRGQGGSSVADMLQRNIDAVLTPAA